MIQMKMNAPKMTGLMLAAITLMVSCKEGPKTAEDPTPVEAVTAQDGGIGFRESGTNQVFEAYLDLKDALVASDPLAAESAATQMLRAPGLDNPAVREELETFLSAEGIEGQRESFSSLVAKLEPVLRDHLSTGTVYKQFCPMAFNNTGGYWFSDSEEIRNPYFGDKMLKCGKVDDRLVAQP
ncbi:DUF3347 domain-containing protein [Robiginitalea sp. SC105]|uniref:DUF3347 domain-containing protein n=1 Tax=Robiginitalea sp. SC105 TaxID=2762332 RepID=UPI0016395899|nr:DUF3347 domain-containing protein [Robiginitalea sp. SC105]MBC2839340.1 DUF3347 domain-containing protein [Robiginitalea sp. SC105]